MMIIIVLFGCSMQVFAFMMYWYLTIVTDSYRLVFVCCFLTTDTANVNSNADACTEMCLRNYYYFSFAAM